MKRHVLTVLMSFVASVISGAVFVLALFHQFALVEVAASLHTGLQAFFLSSAIGDPLNEKKEPNRLRELSGCTGCILFRYSVFGIPVVACQSFPVKVWH